MCMDVCICGNAHGGHRCYGSLELEFQAAVRCPASCREHNSGPLQEQCAFIAAETFLWAPTFSFYLDNISFCKF